MNKWASDFLQLWWSLVIGAVDEDQFEARLKRMGCPDGYVNWLMHMVNRDERTFK